jgi:hypothetical protein
VNAVVPWAKVAFTAMNKLQIAAPAHNNIFFMGYGQPK